MYSCAECKVAVIVIDSKVIKPCDCKAAIVANMSATAHGVGGVKA